MTHNAEIDAPREPTFEEFMAAVDAWKEVERDLDVRSTAHKPIQGEAMHKVFAYRIAKAVLNASPHVTPPEASAR